MTGEIFLAEPELGIGGTIYEDVDGTLHVGSLGILPFMFAAPLRYIGARVGNRLLAKSAETIQG